jgi:hydrogenase expression/formation protein HypC
MCLGIPGQVVEILDGPGSRAVFDVDGVRREISLALLDGESGPGVGVGDWVLVHVGFAMALIDEQEAKATVEALKAMALYGEELAQLEGDGSIAGSGDRPGAGSDEVVA